MKKMIIRAFAVALCFSCSNEEENMNTNTANFDVTIEAIALEQASTDINGEYKGAINPVTFTPESRFNEESKGMYHGIVVSSDTEIHGKIWINLENDGNYNATVVTDTGDKLSFFANMGRGPSITSFATIAFVGERGSFTFDVSDYNHPVATDVVIDNKNSYIQTVKDRSDQRASATLGTFVDLDDETFAGTWDLLADGTLVANFVGSDLATPVPLPGLTQVCIVSPLGDMYVDDVFDLYDYPCVGATGFPPVFYNSDPSATGPTATNEFWAQDQQMDILGITNFYWLGQSTVLSIFNEAENAGWHNTDLFGTGDPGCFGYTELKGIWTWNGRVGSASFDDPFDFVPPPTRSYDASKTANLPQAYLPTSKSEISELTIE